MFASNGRAALRVVALLLTFGLIGLPAAAEAGKPIKPSVPTDLAIGAITTSGTSYVVPATWKAGANTTSFQASVMAGTTVLAQANLTTTSWAPLISAKAGTAITVQVLGVLGKFKGPAATARAVLPDVTAPVGIYSADWGTPAGTSLPVTFSQVSLSDDASAPAAITVKVDFGDGTTPALNPVFPLVHPYAITVGEAKRYQPTITIKDAAGNAATASVNAVVVFDTTPPSGTINVTPANGWAEWTDVTLTTAATDNLSPAAAIKRTIAWGDGSTTEVVGDGTLHHVYAIAGTYTPKVTLSDEAHPANFHDVLGTSVVVRKDTFAPTASLTLPRAKRKSVRSWKVIGGTASDAQTAVRFVKVKAVEKRGAAYYAYVPAKHTWVKVGSKTRAFAKAGYLQVATTGAWKVRLPKLTKGVLVYRVQAVDVMGNLSSVHQHKQRLTKR